ncbi:hypothetical protein OKW21_003082 [Catalinimonas alkaloidigena]|nr:hypothetical protein [Catalinimonas alkaloidigena]
MSSTPYFAVREDMVLTHNYSRHSSHCFGASAQFYNAYIHKNTDRHFGAFLLYC